VPDADRSHAPQAAYAPFRPRRGRVVAWAVVVATLVVFGAMAAFLPFAGYDGWTAWDSLGLAVFGLLVAAVVARFARISAVPGPDGVLVRNVLLSRHLAWDEVERVRFGGGDAWLWLELRDGDELAVMAIQRSDGEHARREASRLVTLLEVSRGRRPGP
jgi:hypothetical protein